MDDIARLHVLRRQLAKLEKDITTKQAERDKLGDELVRMQMLRNTTQGKISVLEARGLVSYVISPKEEQIIQRLVDLADKYICEAMDGDNGPSAAKASAREIVSTLALMDNKRLWEIAKAEMRMRFKDSDHKALEYPQYGFLDTCEKAAREA